MKLQRPVKISREWQQDFRIWSTASDYKLIIEQKKACNLAGLFYQE